ncbi:MAG TPA: peptide ABC transporter substrate-binding protein [Gemmatimonadales bacterium]|nr:peptide ABC transporter substrate-binding protein [Gemmatimonadales bacterium]
MLVATALVVAACGEPPACPSCGTVVVASVQEPAALLPPLAAQSVERDIGDLVWERLADLAAGGASMDEADFRPRLASRWERLDSLTLRFHLRPGAAWHDGSLVTAMDVAFSFAAYQDTALGAPAGSALAGVTVTAADDSTVDLRFPRAYPEQLYDASWHVRVIPRHVWDSVPRAAWAADTALARLVGSGPFRVARWDRGDALVLERTGESFGADAVTRVVWRFVGDPEAALNLVLSGDADVMEAVAGRGRIRQAAADTGLRLERYPSAVYGFLAFNLRGEGGGPHPVLADRRVRLALAHAVNRQTAAQAVFGDDVAVPPGPMSRLLWIWSDSITQPAYSPARADTLLDAAGWRRPVSTRARRGPGGPLRLDILVPATSPQRRDLAQLIQERWRQAGVEATVTAVDFAVFQERLAQGRFDSYIGAWLDEPSPRGLAEQWTRAGWEALNFGHWEHPAFDSLLALAVAEPGRGAAARLWREAMDTLNADAAGIFLYTPINVAAVNRRLREVRIDPYAWASGLVEWRVDPRVPVARDTAP